MPAEALASAAAARGRAGSTGLKLNRAQVRLPSGKSLCCSARHRPHQRRPHQSARAACRCVRSQPGATSALLLQDGTSELLANHHQGGLAPEGEAQLGPEARAPALEAVVPEARAPALEAAPEAMPLLAVQPPVPEEPRVPPAQESLAVSPAQPPAGERAAPAGAKEEEEAGGLPEAVGGDVEGEWPRITAMQMHAGWSCASSLCTFLPALDLMVCFNYNPCRLPALQMPPAK